MRPAGQICDRCGAPLDESVAADAKHCASCAASGEPGGDDAGMRRREEAPELIALKLELEMVEDRWQKQRIRLSTMNRDGSLTRPSGLWSVPATTCCTAAAAWLVRWTVTTKAADGIAFPTALVLIALAVLGWLQIWRVVAYAFNKRSFLRGRSRLKTAIAQAQASKPRSRSAA
jgi:hypothetical protein